MPTKKNNADYLNISLGGKKQKTEKEWILRTAKKTGLTPAWIVTHAVQMLMKAGLKLHA